MELGDAGLSAAAARRIRLRHWLGRLAPRAQAVIHLTAFIVAAADLPIGLSGRHAARDANLPVGPVAAPRLDRSLVPARFGTGAVDPALVRALRRRRSVSPLRGVEPGSFCGLIAYPLLAEPMLPLGRAEVAVERGLRLARPACRLVRAAASPRSSAQAAPAQTTSRVARSTIATWILLAAVPSGLILSTTLHITTDLVAMPLLWVLPLGAYLLSFTVAFAVEQDRRQHHRQDLAPSSSSMTCLGVFWDGACRLSFSDRVAILNVFTVSVALHSRLFDSRPPARHLTLFYLAMSMAGAGQVFCALIAPLIFDWTYEHSAAVVAAAYSDRS